MVSLALIPIAFIALQAWLWRRDIRRRSTVEWRTKRLAAFLDRELTSPCSVAGHEIGANGCEWCNDLTPMWAYRSAEYIYLDPKGDDTLIRRNDKRVAGFHQLGWRWGAIQGGPVGIAFVDRSQPDLNYKPMPLPATSIDEQRAPEYTPLYGDQATQAPPQGGSHRTQRGATSGEAQERIRRTHDPSYSQRLAPPRYR